MNAKISIITPVYNSFPYLDDCIHSIINQTYTNWELILVDDGSSDNSLNICNEYSSKDSRIHVFSKQRSGVSATRNFGLSKAEGDFIMFVDSDDYINPDYLMKFITQYDADLVIGGYQTFGIMNRKFSIDNEFIITDNNWQSIDVGLDNPRINAVYHICSKLYSNKIIRRYSIQFPEMLKLAEDTCFNIIYLQRCKSLRFIEDCGYFYRMASYKNKYKFDFEDYCLHVNFYHKCINNFQTHTGFRFVYIYNSILMAFLMTLNNGIASKVAYNDYIKYSHYISTNLFLPLNALSKRNWLISKAYKYPLWGFLFIKADDLLHPIYMRIKALFCF